MTQEFDLGIARDFGTALLLGALIGLEREKRNEREGFGIAGLRSFILLTQLGAIGGYFSRTLGTPWPLVAVIVAATAVVMCGYFAALRVRPAEIGVTTELAAVVACLLGALATTGHREVAVGLGVGTAALLAYKAPLHAMVGRLGFPDVLVGMRLLLATFIVLPLLPDQAIDPWGVLNPHRLWLLVLLISGLSLVGYVATRWLGPRRGIIVTGIAGGLVSSTAVTLTMVRESRTGDVAPRRLAGGILLAWAVMFVRVVVIAAVVDAALLPRLGPTCGAMAAVCVVAAGLSMRAQAGSGAAASATTAEVPMKNPFSLLAAGKFALLFAAVQLLLELGQRYLPQSGTYAIAALAGTTDVDAITVSMAERANAQPPLTGMAVAAIAIACASNTVVKAGMAIGLGRGLRGPIGGGALAVLVIGGIALAVI